MEKIRKFFADSTVMMVFTILAFICAVVAGISLFQMNDAYSAIIVIFSGILSLCVYFSYTKHEVNIMKSFMGASLAIVLVKVVGGMLALTNPFSIIVCICTLILFITYFYINTQHHSEKSIIALNSVLCIIILVCCIAKAIISGKMFGQNLGAIAFNFADIVALCLIVNIETNIDEYKLLREEKNMDDDWNKESKKELQKDVFEK